MATIYPSDIDGNSQLPLVVDSVSPIRAQDVNNVRNAVVAVETELGINPSGTYGTVKDRLDALDANLEELNIDFISGHIETPSDKTYYLSINTPYSGTITDVTTRADIGSCTATVAINGISLGGSANAVSSSEVTESHINNHEFVVGDDLTLTVSSNSSTADMRFTIKFIRNA